MREISKHPEEKEEKGILRQQYEALSARTESILIVDDDMPVYKHYILITALLFILGFIIWANWATLDEVTRGSGKIIPSSENKTLQSLEGGIVSEFRVREGQKINKGDVILRLRDVEAASDLGTNQQRYFGLLATVQRLEAEATGDNHVSFTPEVRRNVPDSVKEEQKAFQANRQNLTSQLNVLQQQLEQRRTDVEETTGRINDLTEILAISQQEKALIEPLVERGSAPRIELLQLERTVLEHQTELNSLKSTLNRAQATVNEAEAKIEELQNQTKARAQDELAGTTTELNSLREALKALKDRKTRTDITSPVDGIIQDLLVNTVGGVVQPGADIVEIVPLDENLLVEARIRPSDIAFLYPGMKAIVKITAYDYSIYGSLNGELIDISADTITDEQGQSFYRVRIKTTENELKRNGDSLPIFPGMVASVDILTGEKTIMEYILKPILKTVNNAMKER